MLGLPSVLFIILDHFQKILREMQHKEWKGQNNPTWSLASYVTLCKLLQLPEPRMAHL